MAKRPILIAGGGPVGVIAALALARQGLEVRVFEAMDAVNDAPRASTTCGWRIPNYAAIGIWNRPRQWCCQA